MKNERIQITIFCISLLVSIGLYGMPWFVAQDLTVARFVVGVMVVVIAFLSIIKSIETFWCTCVAWVYGEELSERFSGELGSIFGRADLKRLLDHSEFPAKLDRPQAYFFPLNHLGYGRFLSTLFRMPVLSGLIAAILILGVILGWKLSPLYMWSAITLLFIVMYTEIAWSIIGPGTLGRLHNILLQYSTKPKNIGITIRTTQGVRVSMKQYILYFIVLLFTTIIGYTGIYTALCGIFGPSHTFNCPLADWPLYLQILYFSMVTISTVGYGDITALHWVTALFAITEILAGFLLLVVLVLLISVTVSTGQR